MKKILALLVAVALLCLPVALAEGAGNHAAALGLTNINVMGIDLGDLEVWLGIEGADVPGCLVSANVGDEVLVSGVGQLEDGQFKFMFDGEDKAYALDLNQVAQQAAQQMGGQAAQVLNQLPEVVKQLIPMLDSVVLPPIPALSIPKFDLAPVIASISEDGQNFTITTDMVDSLLDMAQQYADTAAATVPQVKQFTELIPQLKGQLSLDGSVANEGDAQVTRVNLYAGGQLGATLVLTSRENSMRLAVEADGAEQVALALNAYPEDLRTTLDVEAMGTRVGGLTLYQEDGLQKIAIDLDAGEAMRFEVNYGNGGSGDVVRLALDAGSSGSMDFTLNTAKQADGSREGTLTFDANFGGDPVNISADVTMYLAESLEMGEIAWPATLLPFDQLDAESAMAPVVEYIQGIAQDSAA